MSLIAELKQRKLVQWAVAYVAAVFALLQGIDIVAQRFGWPDSIERILIIAACVGFFVVLVLAWYHGERGAQKVSSTELIILTLLLAIGGGLLWHFAATVPVAASPTPVAQVPAVTPPTQPPAAPDKSIAVLPFENLSSDKDNEYFASGMQDMVLTKLADIGELKVISRTSTEKYKSHPDNLKQIAQELGVRNILEGSVQKAGNQVLINVQLIDAATDEHIWAQAYTKTLDNIFGVEGQVAQMVADALKAKLSPAEAQKLAKVGTRNKDAYDLYLRAGYFIDTANRSGDRENLKRSIELLQKAIALDAKYADAYALLALDYAKLGGHADEQEAAARRALALDPGNARAQAEMAFVLSFRGDSVGALEHMREAVRLEPANPAVHYALGFILSEDGSMEEAAAAFARAAALDPKSNFLRLGVAGTAISRRRYSDAIDALQVSVARDPQDMLSIEDLFLAEQLNGDLAAARKVLEAASAAASEAGSSPTVRSALLGRLWSGQYMLEHDFPSAVRVLEQVPQSEFDNAREPRGNDLGSAERAQGHAEQARTAFASARIELEGWLKSDPKNSGLHDRLALALAGVGEYDAALREAAQAQSLMRRKGEEPGILIDLAQVQARAGRTDDAFKTLEKLSTLAYGGDALSAALLRLDPDWDVLRKDPRFDATVARFVEAEKAASK